MPSNFFKLPIEAVLKNMPHPVEFNEAQWAIIDGLNQYRFFVLVSARRTGKSYGASLAALAKMLEPGRNVMVVAPNYTLSSVIWDYVYDHVKQLQLETLKINQKDKVIQLSNGSVFRLASANVRDSLVGRGYHLIIVDEAAIIESDEYFTRDLRPTLSTYPDSRCLWISTPRGRQNYLYEYYNRGIDKDRDTWGCDLYTWHANPLLSEQDIKEAEATMSQAEFKQEYYCDWVSIQGMIYPAINDDKHLGDYRQIKFPEYIAGLDVGYRDPNAFTVLGFSNGYYHVVDEFIIRECTTSYLADVIKEKEEQWNIENIYIDSAASQLKADLAYDHDIYTTNAIKSVNDGIKFVQHLTETDRLLFDIEGGLGTYNAMTSYTWKETTELQKPNHDEHSHASDAVRYAVYTHHLMNSMDVYIGEDGVPNN